MSLYAKELAEKLPEGIDCMYFTSSGSEANSLATQMARHYTGNWTVLTQKCGYHGHAGSQHLTAVNSWNHDLPKTQGIDTTVFPDMLRGPWKHDPELADESYSQLIKETIEFNTSGKVALWMVEPIQGAGGLNPLRPSMVQKAAKYVREAGGLILADEVQTGFGRIGTHYWGADYLGIKPDIVTMAKTVGNGMPLGVVACSQEVANSMAGKLTFATYGSNPLAMVAGREVLKVVEEDGLQ